MLGIAVCGGESDAVPVNGCVDVGDALPDAANVLLVDKVAVQVPVGVNFEETVAVVVCLFVAEAVEVPQAVEVPVAVTVTVGVRVTDPVEVLVDVAESVLDRVALRVCVGV